MTEPGIAAAGPFGLFEAFGVEMEYMIADAESLDVRPICDEVFAAVAGESVAEFVPEPGNEIAWSNELCLHVLEMKTEEPAAALEPLIERFERSVRRADAALEEFGAVLLPGAMHPWMDPEREARLWPHEYSAVYRTFDRIFSCRGHGWANLQSTHLNLPFGDDAEFGRLHAAIRPVLALLPALAASSPIADGMPTGIHDFRLESYRTNARRVPSVCGLVVPERAFSRADYEREILGRIYEDLRELDPEGVLRHEWVNARGCIARFDRGAIEIRVIDVQECPRADLAILALVTRVVRELVEERNMDPAALRALDERTLHQTLRDAIREGEEAIVRDDALLAALGLPGGATRAGDAWAALAERLVGADEPWAAPLAVIRDRGTLATRILRRAGERPDMDDLRTTWQELGDCLREGRMLDAP